MFSKMQSVFQKHRPKVEPDEGGGSGSKSRAPAISSRARGWHFMPFPRRNQVCPMLKEEGTEARFKIAPDNKARSIIVEHMTDEEKVNRTEKDSVGFLTAISACCVAAKKDCQEKLDLPYSKAELAEAIVEVMEKLPQPSVPTSVLSCAMVAINNLSKIKPPLDPELESHVLHLALHGVFTMAVVNDDVGKQALYRSSSENLESMLRSLLAEDPTTPHLLRILKHINLWMHSNDAMERARAIGNSVSLLRYALLMPELITPANSCIWATMLHSSLRALMAPGKPSIVRPGRALFS